MYLNLRPSKVVFERRLRQALAAAEPYDDVLDCACAAGKHRYMFPAKTYYGVDIDAERIERAKEQYREAQDCFFYHDDMTGFLSDIRNKRFGVVVSTHTLTHISEDRKSLAVSNLADQVQPGGSLIIQSTHDNLAVCKTVADRFANVTLYCYRGALSRVFEEFIAWLYKAPVNDPLARSGPRAGLYRRTNGLMLFKSKVISWLDWMGRPDHFLLHLSGKQQGKE